MPLDCQRSLFSLSDDVVYLNCAYMSPQLKSVEAAGRHALGTKNEPYRLRTDDFFEPVAAVKRSFARLINTDDQERVALLPAVSYGMGIVARNLPLERGQKIVIARDQFPSNYYPWARLVQERGAELQIISAPAHLPHTERTAAWNEALLTAIDERTALVALAHVHWADGTIYDLEALRRRTREVGAWLVIDGTQSIGALPFDVERIQPDALIASGYKCLMGPYATAYGYFGPVFDEGTPLEENWINRHDSHDFKQLVNYQHQYRPKANRYSVGEHSNFILVPMMQAALDQLLAWGVEDIQDYCRQLVEPYLPALAELGIELPAVRAHHLFGLPLNEKIDETRLQEELSRRQIYISTRGQYLRVSTNVYNRRADVEQLIGALQQASRSSSVAI